MSDLDKFLAALDGDGELKTCLRCHHAFLPRVSWQHFCSPDCRIAYNNRRATGRRPDVPPETPLDDLS